MKPTASPPPIITTMKSRPSLFVLPLLLAATITSCVDTGSYGGQRSSYGGGASYGGSSYGGGRGYYTTLPPNYSGNAYYYNGRYYSGGNYQTGRYTYQGRTYTSRYYQNGQYLYGGTHQHHAGSGSQQRQDPRYQDHRDRDDRNDRDDRDDRDSRYDRDDRDGSSRDDSRYSRSFLSR